MIWMPPEDCLNKIAEMPNEYTNTMDKNVMDESQDYVSQAIRKGG